MIFLLDKQERLFYNTSWQFTLPPPVFSSPVPALCGLVYFSFVDGSPTIRTVPKVSIGQTGAPDQTFGTINRSLRAGGVAPPCATLAT